MDVSDGVSRLGGASAAQLVCEQQRGDAEEAGGGRDRTRGPPRWKWWLHPDSRKELRLTDQQSKKIDEVWEVDGAEAAREVARAREAGGDPRQDDQGKHRDVAIVAQQVEKVEKLRAENNATRTVMIYRMHLLLTPEQRVKVDEMRARMDAERKKQEEERKRQGRGDKRTERTTRRRHSRHDFDRRTFHLEAVREQDRIITTHYRGADPRSRRRRWRAAAAAAAAGHRSRQGAHRAGDGAG